MIYFEHVYKHYPAHRDALRDVNFHIAAGEMVFLTGQSGAGKSTLLKLLALIERVSSGQIILSGKNINKLKNSSIPFLRRKLGLIFQDYQLLMDRNVFDNVALPLVIAGYSQKDIKKRVRAALDKVNLLHKEKSCPITLSGGEQQRVGIARAVVNKPALLLADEPTGNLDPELSKEIMNLFEEFNRVGVTILIASHDLYLIQQLQKRTIRLQQGCLVTI